MDFTIENYMNFCDEYTIAQESIGEKFQNAFEKLRNLFQILANKANQLINKIKEAVSKYKRFEIQKDYEKVYKHYLTIIAQIYASDDERVYNQMMQKYERLEPLKQTVASTAEANKNNKTIISETPFKYASAISKKIAQSLGEVNSLMKKPDANADDITRLKQRIENLKFAYKLCDEAFNFLVNHSNISKASKEERKGQVTKLNKSINAEPVLV